MSSLRIVVLVVLATAIGRSAAYGGGRNWGYKTEIHHPAKSSYGHGVGGDHGYSHVERYQSPPKYHYETKYEVPSKYHHEEEHYEIEKPKYHHSSGYHKPKYYSKPKSTYYTTPPPTTTPPPKKDDDHLGLKFNFEMPFTKMFDKFGGKEAEPKEEPEPETYGYGYDKKTTTPPPEEEKKEFEIKIPKIDVEKMIPSFKS